MRAQPPSVPPLPDPRAMLVVVDAVRTAPGGTRDALANAVLNHPQAPGFDATELRRLAESYGDAQQGFRRPDASAGYVLAALYTIRRRVALWIGLPFLVLVGVGSAFWAVTEWNRTQELSRIRSRSIALIERARQDYRAANDELDAIESALRSAQPRLPNEPRIRDLLQAFRERESEARTFFSGFQPYRGPDLRRVRRLRQEADEAASLVSGMQNLLEQANEQLRKSLDLRIARDELDALLKDAKAMNLEREQMERIEAAHASGAWASEQGEEQKLRDSIRELSRGLARARELIELPQQLNALIGKIRSVALDEEDRKRAEALYREGRDAAAASHVPVMKETQRQLAEMAATLDEEYTIVITGGKWRVRNNNRSVRNYYVIVEAVDPSGRRLPRTIRSEEDRSVTSVTTWGERVPFDVYERVRLDKQDNGVIDQSVFGKKERGRMEERVTLLLDNGDPLPRAGRITRW